MIPFLAAKLLGLGIPAKLAKPFVWAALAVGLVALLSVAKCTYDRHVVSQARLAGNAEAIGQKATADVHATERRAEDQARRTEETRQVQEAIQNAKADGRDMRAAYYDCVRLQQAARKAHRPAPAHC